MFACQLSLSVDLVTQTVKQLDYSDWLTYHQLVTRTLRQLNNTADQPTSPTHMYAHTNCINITTLISTEWDAPIRVWSHAVNI